MLETLRFCDVGLAPAFEITFRERINLLAGDNGLGKTFLLDAAWWALTRTDIVVGESRRLHHYDGTTWQAIPNSGLGDRGQFRSLSDIWQDETNALWVVSASGDGWILRCPRSTAL